MKKICLGKLSSVGNGKLSLWNAIIQTTCKRPYNDVKAWSQRCSEEENKIILRVLIFPFSLSTCQLQCNKCNVPLIYTPPTYFSQRCIKDITHNPWENKWLNCHRRYVKFEHCKCEIERDTHRENVCRAKSVSVFKRYLSSVGPAGFTEHHKQDLRQQAEQNEQDDDQPGWHRAQHVGEHKVQTLLLQERPAWEGALLNKAEK